MRARHVTSEKDYRFPYGAVQLGGTVMLAINVWDEVTFCTLRVWTDEAGEELIEMRGTPEGDHLRFEVNYTPAATGVVWYSFDLEAPDGSVWRYGAREGWTTGVGAFAYGDPPSFQITVYEPREVKPDWFKNAVVYQIFPDRFARGKDWEKRVAASLERPLNGVPRAVVEDWDTPPSYKRVSAEDLRIAEWDFYGGTLQGVTEKLDYLAGLGVTVIYLNPIFEAHSNHRYDTADYLRIDPMLGTEKDFVDLCAAAEKRGISVILDGVFNHCGRDSVYFNRDGNYDAAGAWQAHVDGEKSEYDGWFSFNEDGTYAGWWGNQDMPTFNADTEAYHELICGPNGVVRKWMRLGARGWRLDVADELTDDFIAEIKAAVLAERADGVLIGEVWEDASNKVAYGKLRQYFQGKELDCTMNYPFRTGVLDFVCNHIGAPELAARLRQLQENYPRDAFYQALNLLGSHDRERLFTVLGGAPDADSMDEAARGAYRLDEGQAGLAMARLWVCALLQMTLPGVPSVYYGDERGVEGFRDPFNRASFPWDGGRMNATTIYRNAIALRKTLPELVDGDFEPFSAGEDVFGFWRRGADGNSVCVLANASLSSSHTVQVPMITGQVVDDVVSGQAPEVKNGHAQVFLWPLGTAVLRFSAKERLQSDLPAGMGVLCHVTSVPNEGGKPGTLGKCAYKFVDWLAEAGVAYWQVLPVNPADGFGSPYAGLAAFAGNTALLDRSVAEVMADAKKTRGTAAYRDFCEVNEYWLTAYATFCAIKDLLGDGPWQSWPAPYHDYSPELANLPQLKEGVERHRLLQYEFSLEWSRLRSYANSRGVAIVGDMPMFVSADSADVWAEPDIFEVDEKGNAALQAGAPGDAFAPEGQLWGNPTYRWDVLREQGYGWWLCRFGRAMETYDYVRLDHFIGFSSYYAIPQGGTAADGQFKFGPGLELFEVARKKLGPLPFVAEDLGNITPAVRALVSATGIPGMDIVQFNDGDVRQGYQPKKGTVAFTGTHDNQTLLGWVSSRFGVEGDAARELADDIMAKVLTADASVAVVPLQDVLGLDDSARMNVPGTAEGNWCWQANAADVEAASGRLAELVALHREGR